ncbi:MAG: hypothetical protein CVU09_04560 [Bacteroidetes bacterium HGW-Bacteroidetes-4]|nr:MAG: hypothetical protein CVU09_04560 [Bacteroidetes bacterium HGW-Bacteroidetes-4]
MQVAHSQYMLLLDIGWIMNIHRVKFSLKRSGRLSDCIWLNYNSGIPFFYVYIEGFWLIIIDKKIIAVFKYKHNCH